MFLYGNYYPYSWGHHLFWKNPIRFVCGYRPTYCIFPEIRKYGPNYFKRNRRIIFLFFAHFTSSFPFSKSVSKDFALYILSAIFLHSGQTQSPSKMEIKQIMLKSGKRTQLINDNNPNKSILMIPLLFTNANKFQPPCSSMGSRLIHLPSCGLR